MADKELLAAIKTEMGTIATQITERIERSEAKAKEMDEKIAGLAKSEAGAAVADAYGRALKGGTPHAARADETAEEFVERFVEEENERQIVLAVRNKTPFRGRVQGTRAGLDAMRILRAIAVARMDMGLGGQDAPSHDAVFNVLRGWGDKHTSGLVEHARDMQRREASAAEKTRGMNSVVLGAGAGFVTSQVFAGLIDFLWPKTVVRQLGAMSVPTTKNMLELLYVDSAASATRRGQTSHATQTSSGEKRLRVVPELLSAFIAASNELLRESDISLDVFFRAMLARAVGQKENLDFLTSVGTGPNDIKGFDWWVDNAKNPMVSASHKANRTLDTGLPTFKTSRKDLLLAQQVVAEENIDMSLGRPGYAMSTATKYGLMRCLNNNDIPVFGDEMRGGTLLGAAFADTTVIPRNEVGDAGGSGTGNKAKVYFADWSTFIIAEDPNIDVKVADGAAYRDAGGNVVAGFTSNETVFAIHAKNASGCLQRGKELYRIDSTDWHAAF